MQQIQQAIAAGRLAPINDEAHGSPQTAGPLDNKTQHGNTSGYSIPLQAASQSKLRWTPAALFTFVRHLVRLQSVELALWVTAYDMAPDCAGDCE